MGGDECGCQHRRGRRTWIEGGWEQARGGCKAWLLCLRDGRWWWLWRIDGSGGGGAYSGSGALQ